MSEIHTTPAERLVTMANQIARAFTPLGEERAVPKIAEHIKAFWDPRMRRGIAEHVAAGGAGLQPFALAAIRRLEDGGAAHAVPEAQADGASAQAHTEAADRHNTDHHDGGRWRFRLPGFSRLSGH
jgi:formate dehydrogenase subunit delta